MESLPGYFTEIVAVGMLLTTIPENRWPTASLINDKLHQTDAPVLAVGLVPFSSGDGGGFVSGFSS